MATIVLATEQEKNRSGDYCVGVVVVAVGSLLFLLVAAVAATTEWGSGSRDDRDLDTKHQEETHAIDREIVDDEAVEAEME